MSDQKPRKYCGNGVQSGDFYINLSLKKSQIDQHFFEYNGEQYVRLTVGKNREVTQYGKSHSVWINEYQPDDNKSNNTQKATVNAGDGLPF